jgi:phosphopantetheine adenylyltransferase
MRSYKIYIDENFPRQLAEGLNILQQAQNRKEGLDIEVLSIKTVFGEGAKDEDWIPKVGKEKGIVITQDFRIQTQKHQKELYIENKVGILFFNPPSNNGFTYWEMVKQLVNKWDDIKQIVKKNNTPFAYRTSAKTKFDKLD